LFKKLEIVSGRIRNFFPGRQQATAVTVEKGKRKDVANTVGTPAKAGTLSKVVKPTTACRKANYRDDSSSVVHSSKAARISRSQQQ
jgi:hypothetical protein